MDLAKSINILNKSFLLCYNKKYLILTHTSSNLWNFQSDRSVLCHSLGAPFEFMLMG